MQDRVREFSAPQLAAICGGYVNLGRRGHGHSQLLDAIVGQVLRSFKAGFLYSPAPRPSLLLQRHALDILPAHKVHA